QRCLARRHLHSFPTRRPSDLGKGKMNQIPQRNIVTYSRAIPPSAARTLHRKSIEKKKSQSSSAKSIWNFVDDYFVSKTSFTLNRDRKSTRLKSSHVKTSYAVF